jgi:hypothetical protein
MQVTVHTSRAVHARQRHPEPPARDPTHALAMLACTFVLLPALAYKGHPRVQGCAQGVRRGCAGGAQGVRTARSVKE